MPGFDAKEKLDYLDSAKPSDTTEVRTNIHICIRIATTNYSIKNLVLIIEIVSYCHG